jgi:predicted TIM-barrel fold metal-dependent hydrolase
LVQDLRNLRLLERGGLLVEDKPEQLILARMNAGGIGRACLLGPNPRDGTTLTNELVHRMVAWAPDRFIGFVGVDPVGQGADRTRAEIERAVEEWNFRGVGEIGGEDLLAPAWEVVYATCLERQLPILLHVGIPLPSMSLRESHPFVLDELANRHRDLTIIAAHVGAPWIIETLSVAVRHPNVYLDISTLPSIRKGLVPAVLALCTEQGLEERVLFGSDYPVVDPCRYAQTIRRLSVPAPVRWVSNLPKISPTFKRRILGENAMSLLRVPDQ